jgi:hypothetical protein
MNSNRVIRELRARGLDKSNYSGYVASNYCTIPPSGLPGACYPQREAYVASTAAVGQMYERHLLGFSRK